MCSCHSILECCVTFSGVKLSIRSVVLFYQYFNCTKILHRFVSFCISLVFRFFVETLVQEVLPTCPGLIYCPGLEHCHL